MSANIADSSMGNHPLAAQPSAPMPTSVDHPQQQPHRSRASPIPDPGYHAEVTSGLHQLLVKQLHESINAYKQDKDYCQQLLHEETTLTPQEVRTLRFRILDLSHQLRQSQHKLDLVAFEAQTGANTFTAVSRLGSVSAFSPINAPCTPMSMSPNQKHATVALSTSTIPYPRHPRSTAHQQHLAAHPLPPPPMVEVQSGSLAAIINPTNVNNVYADEDIAGEDGMDEMNHHHHHHHHHQASLEPEHNHQHHHVPQEGHQSAYVNRLVEASPAPSHASSKRRRTNATDFDTPSAWEDTSSMLDLDRSSLSTTGASGAAVAHREGDGTAIQRLGYWDCRLCTSSKFMSAGANRQPRGPCKWPLRDVAKMITHFMELHVEHEPNERCAELGSALDNNRGPFEYWLRRSHSISLGDGSVIDECIVALKGGRVPDVLRRLSRSAAKFP